MKIAEILSWLTRQGYDYRFIGDGGAEIRGFSALANYKDKTLTWIKKEENYDALNRPRNISCAVIQSGVNVDFENAIITDSSKEIFFAILHEFWGEKKKEGLIGEGTVISEQAVIDPTVTMGCNCSIVGDIVIGAHTIIEHNVVIQGSVRIGEGCHIQSEAVIGIDGFGYSKDPHTGSKKMVEHFGGVEIGNNVFIGSHVNIARGTIDDTVIGNGVKIAPSTHIGHNNIIGENATIICSTLYGSVKTGSGSYITASTIQNQTEIGEHTVVGMGSVVMKPIGDNVIAYGIPAKVAGPNESGL